MLGNNSCNVLSLRSSLHKPHFTHYHTLMGKTERKDKRIKAGCSKAWSWSPSALTLDNGTTKSANLFSVPGYSKDSCSTKSSFISPWFRAKAEAIKCHLTPTHVQIYITVNLQTEWETVNPSSLTPNPMNLGDIQDLYQWLINISHCCTPHGGSNFLSDGVPGSSSL